MLAPCDRKRSEEENKTSVGASTAWQQFDDPYQKDPIMISIIVLDSLSIFPLLPVFSFLILAPTRPLLVSLSSRHTNLSLSAPLSTLLPTLNWLISDEKSCDCHPLFFQTFPPSPSTFRNNFPSFAYFQRCKPRCLS